MDVWIIKLKAINQCQSVSERSGTDDEFLGEAIDNHPKEQVVAESSTQSCATICVTWVSYFSSNYVRKFYEADLLVLDRMPLFVEPRACGTEPCPRVALSMFAVFLAL